MLVNFTENFKETSHLPADKVNCNVQELLSRRYFLHASQGFFAVDDRLRFLVCLALFP